ncbi:2-succinyl-6-hydroxy-2, 4-cyclohexadiene-1-carboxylate synthase [Paraliobacillus ryukyuensis]|uniref:Peptidase S9 prolyl oligopeptidase catalytic domain-containing protein n=1 Tax=Paraliobacillus ryukyuensis TaxID=200904 RepID=A0A366E7Q1_9BACI|nr:alpha/beta hydrolase [Paraliobacillus ryukyuensis]RBO98342.1 hypothetical protein DES48_105195 [Paraliobacillus ryukyuensis]
MLSIIIGLITLVLVGLVGAGFYFYHVAIARGEKPFLSEDPDLQVDDELDLSSKEDKQWWNDQEFAKWQQQTPDHLHLYGYFLQANKPTRHVAIVAHGYSGDAKTMSGFARLYHEVYGMHVLVPDARGHGISEGDYIGFGWHERLDYQRWIAQVLQQLGNDMEIVLHGVSMGAATVMMTSGEKLPDQVKAIIADCGYTSAMEELRYQMKRMYHLPAFPILHITSLLAKLKSGYSFQEASALNQVKKTTKPMLYVHGKEDAFVPTFMVHKLYQATNTNQKELLLIPRAGHGLAWQTDSQTYYQRLTAFLSKHLTEVQQADDILL